MKKLIQFAAILILMIALLGCQKTPRETAEDTKGNQITGTITIYGAWALYPMVIKWAEEYRLLHPDVKTDISAGGAGKGMADALARVVDFGMVSRAVHPEEVKKGAWWISVTKDAVVPTINEKNPVIEHLLTSGIKKETFKDIWISEKVKNWNYFTSEKNSLSIHVYTRSDACGAAETWAAFLGYKQEDLNGVGVYGDPGLAAAITSDVLGIGFNNINYAYDPGTRKQIKGIRVVPIDLNGDGRISEEENYYDNQDLIVDAIARGNYPSPPARDLHFVFQGKPTRAVVIDFIEWVLTEGQKFVAEAGYINLSQEKIQEELKKLE